MLCTKFGWNWPSGPGEEDENVKRLQTDGRTDGRTDRQRTDDRWSEKLTWAFSSGELKNYWSQNPCGLFHSSTRSCFHRIWYHFWFHESWFQNGWILGLGFIIISLVFSGRGLPGFCVALSTSCFLFCAIDSSWYGVRSKSSTVTPPCNRLVVSLGVNLCRSNHLCTQAHLCNSNI